MMGIELTTDAASLPSICWAGLRVRFRSSSPSAARRQAAAAGAHAAAAWRPWCCRSARRKDAGGFKQRPRRRAGAGRSPKAAAEDSEQGPPAPPLSGMRARRKHDRLGMEGMHGRRDAPRPPARNAECSRAGAPSASEQRAGARAAAKVRHREPGRQGTGPLRAMRGPRRPGISRTARMAGGQEGEGGGAGARVRGRGGRLACMTRRGRGSPAGGMRARGGIPRQCRRDRGRRPG